MGIHPLMGTNPHMGISPPGGGFIWWGSRTNIQTTV